MVWQDEQEALNTFAPRFTAAADSTGSINCGAESRQLDTSRSLACFTTLPGGTFAWYSPHGEPSLAFAGGGAKEDVVLLLRIVSAST